jgi:transposase-like protein
MFVMVTDKIKQLQELQAQAANLQQSIEAERTKELAALPTQYGFDSVESFIKAVRAAGGKGKGKRGRKPKAASSGGGKRSRTKITPELKQQVVAAVNAGKTGAAIAGDFGISLPSVQNIKKEAGLVKARGGDQPAAAPTPAPAPAEG